MLEKNSCFLLLILILCADLVLSNVPENVEKTLGCGDHGDCVSNTTIECQEKCGCDRAYYYNETANECVLDIKNLMRILIKKYDPQALDNAEEGMAKKIRIEAEKLFKGIIISVIIFVSCATIYVITACLYCFRINYTDRVLRKDVKTIAKKLNKDEKFKKPIKETRKPVSESCNVIVEDAGVFIV